ncbi:hypothetical protein THOE12_10378 [Vibrio rotiferianus]|nr:hypothetical protein THOE12_10378 [Vibrio rotiferianus]
MMYPSATTLLYLNNPKVFGIISNVILYDLDFDRDNNLLTH